MRLFTYTGTLYGKIGKRYIPLQMDSHAVEKLQDDLQTTQLIAEAAIKEIERLAETGDTHGLEGIIQNFKDVLSGKKHLKLESIKITPPPSN